MSGNNNKPAKGGTQISYFAKEWLLSSTARIMPLAVAGFVMFGPTPSYADGVSASATPQGGSVVGGSATITRPNNKSVRVNQASNRAVINWTSFNIGKDASAEFNQPSASAIAVNRVTGGTDPSQIMGSLKANGQIVILDPNGVVFGKSAKVDVGGLVASTGSVDTQKFMQGGKLELTGMTTGRVENLGQITAKDGGLVALVAPHAVNSGVIEARLGRVELASGNAVTVDFYGDQLVSVAVTGAAAQTLVENSGTIAADGGRIAMTAKAAQGVVDDVVNMSGVLQANTVGVEKGRIVIGGGHDGTVHVTGDVSAKGTLGKGGHVEFTGHRIELDGATVDASGATGGGNIYVGGDWNGAGTVVTQRSSETVVSADTVLKADATFIGDGGEIVVWGDDLSYFAGRASAKGGYIAGDGGRVEVSTGEAVEFLGSVDTTARNGLMGYLLIDPATVTIGNAPHAPDTYLNASVLANTLQLSNITVQADTNIDIAEAINLATGDTGTTTGNFTLLTNTVNLLGDVSFGSGIFRINSQVLNLDGQITSGASLIPTARLQGTATQVNVLSDAANIQQAINASSTTAPVTVNVAAGQYTGNITIGRAGMILRGDVGDAAAGAGDNAPDIYGTVASGNLITVNAANVTIEGLRLHGDIASTTNRTANGITGSGSGAAVLDNDFVNFSNSGIRNLFANNLTIDNNYFTNISFDAVSEISGNGIFVRNNLIEGDGAGNFGAGRYGIHVADSQNVQILNNTIRGLNGGTGAMNTGIYVQNDDGSLVDGNLIEGLTGGTGAVQNGILSVNSDNATITNNTVHSDGEAGTVGVGGTAFNFDASNLNLTDVNNVVITDTPSGGGDTGGGDTGGGDTGGGDTGGGDTGGGDTGGGDTGGGDTGGGDTGGGDTGGGDTTDPRIERLQESIDRLEDKIERIEERIENLESRLDDTRNPLVRLKIKIEIKQLEQEQKQAERKIEVLEDKIEHIENQNGNGNGNGHGHGKHKHRIHKFFSIIKHIFSR